MIPDPDKLPQLARDKRASNKELIKKLKRINRREVDKLFHEAHEEAFSCIDCLECANCCKTTGPKFTDKDVERISRHLKLKPVQFFETYLRIDEDGDQVLQQVPCSFLGDNNRCSIYDVRPKACAEYPQTDRVKQSQLLNLSLKNTEVCPAVYDIFEKLKKRI